MNYAVFGRLNSGGSLTAAARNHRIALPDWRRQVPLLHASQWSWKGCGREIKRNAIAYEIGSLIPELLS